MWAEATALPVTVEPVPGEALDSYLERVAAHNSLDNATLIRRLRVHGDTAAFMATSPAAGVQEQISALTKLAATGFESATLRGLVGVDFHGLDPRDRRTWRVVAARGWAPARGTAICPRCLADDGIWRVAWRHPWVTTCLTHRTWLLATCPRCGLRFRSQRTPLRTVDSTTGSCGNPGGQRGGSCAQPLTELDAGAAPTPVLASAERIWAAINGNDVDVLGTPLAAAEYLAEIKAFTVLLLHLATQPGGNDLANWAEAARADRERSAGTRGARWGLAPPADLQLRGQAIATADAILRKPDLDDAADSLHPWVELTPSTNDGQLGWLADHTTMTPRLTRLVMAATAQRRRLSTLLAGQSPIEPRFIPQALPADLYDQNLSRALGVTDITGRVFASLCLAKLGRPGCTWPDAAALLILDSTAVDAVRACTGQILCGLPAFTDHLAAVAHALLAVGVDYRARQEAVRTLATRCRWYGAWARHHRPGALAASRRYAITYLWTSYASSTPRSSPGWAQRPTATELAYYRRYAASIDANAEPRAALLKLVEHLRQPRFATSGDAPRGMVMSATSTELSADPATNTKGEPRSKPRGAR